MIRPNVTSLEVIRLESERPFSIPNNIDNLSIKYKRKGIVFFGNMIFWDARPVGKSFRLEKRC